MSVVNTNSNIPTSGEVRPAAPTTAATPQKKSLGELLLSILEQKNYLKSKIDLQIQLCVEVIDMPKENYFKSTV